MQKLEAERALANSDNEGASDSEAKSEVASMAGGNGIVERPYYMVCRPKVGDTISGGGFLGIWKKRRDMRNRNGIK
jgi:hypothetical protein